MNEWILSFILSVNCAFALVWDLGAGHDYDDVSFGTNDIDFMNWTVRKTVKRYYCALSEPYLGEYIPIYGTNAWNFPIQDVNLTLNYPILNSDQAFLEEYTIVWMEIILCFDGMGSRGYISAGGILQDHISLTFIMSNITELEYQFTVHAAPKRNLRQELFSGFNFGPC